ncbi:hypothetical protein PIN31115_02829 [Pandoraea iniqua]|uniref:TubC N-terminal docking domain-containing protein n=1 Tax=Pandoraea iniqua TaxID=2508288 RepID=A0A5E4VS22_9BURK|nr:hypothetical protein [Pandoraea iniqua]VVE15041.1 hypothetical protein PIN31115_02829 [Pandoraea iniqua]
MNAFEVWFLCRDRKVSLVATRPTLKYWGPADVLAEIVPLIRRHKVALLDLVESLDGLPVADGPFIPYTPLVSPEMLREWQAELMTLFARCVRHMGWGDEAIEEMQAALYRMPVYTVWIDLVHYRELAASIEQEEAKQ